MSKGPDGGLRIGAAAGYGPRAPYLTPGARVDLGPAGSLIQARGWLRTARISGRPAAHRDWRLWTAAALTAAGVALLALGVGVLSAAIASGQLVGWLLGLLGLLIVLAGGLGGIGAVGAVQACYRQGPVEAELSTQIRREQHSARELDLLRPLGWTVLHDRLAPGTEHRLAHVLAGPGGLVVATVLPVADPLRRYGRQLYTGQVPLQEWFTTRCWEAWTLQAAVTARLAHWPWPGLPDRADARRRRAAGRAGAARDAAVPARPGRGADPGQRHGPGLCPGAPGVAGPARGRRARRRGPGGLPTRRSAGQRAGRRLTPSPPGGRHRHNQLRARTDSIRTALPSAPGGHWRPALPAGVAGGSRRSGRTGWPGTAPAIGTPVRPAGVPPPGGAALDHGHQFVR